MERNDKLDLYKTIKIIIVIVLISIVFYCIIKNINNVKSLKELESTLDNFSKKIKDRNNEIDNFISKALETYGYTDLYDKPYLPKDFKYIEGDWNNGYVIQDENGNEYVWVPCVLYENNDVVKLNRKDFKFNEANVPNQFEGFKNNLNESIEACYENDSNIEMFITSIAKNGGFYIGRYETGIEGENVIVKANAMPYTNLTYKEVQKIAELFYEGRDDINCSLINGFAYDTTLSWIEKKYNDFAILTENNGNKSGFIKNTGIFSVNNIFDLNGNAYEITTEMVEYDLIVLRGSKLFNYEAGCRTLISRDSAMDYIGFRIILYE